MTEKIPIPTQIIINKETGEVIKLINESDLPIIKILAENRLNICKQCEYLFYREELPVCGYCGCGLSRKINIIYTVDDDGKAISGIKPEGGYTYICRIKKW